MKTTGPTGFEYDALMQRMLAYRDGVARCNLPHIGSDEAAANAMIAEGLAHWVPNPQDPGNREVDCLRWLTTEGEQP